LHRAPAHRRRTIDDEGDLTRRRIRVGGRALRRLHDEPEVAVGRAVVLRRDGRAVREERRLRLRAADAVAKHEVAIGLAAPLLQRDARAVVELRRLDRMRRRAHADQRHPRAQPHREIHCVRLAHLPRIAHHRRRICGIETTRRAHREHQLVRTLRALAIRNEGQRLHVGQPHAHRLARPDVRDPLHEEVLALLLEQRRTTPRRARLRVLAPRLLLATDLCAHHARTDVHLHVVDRRAHRQREQVHRLDRAIVWVLEALRHRHARHHAAQVGVHAHADLRQVRLLLRTKQRARLLWIGRASGVRVDSGRVRRGG
jgi:hypothetical protein